MPDVQHKRGSRADLNTLAAANGLLLGQIYVITDEDRLAVATGIGTYQAYIKEGDNLTAGFSSDAESLGTISSGTLSLDIADEKENFKSMVNGGAFTLAVPTVNTTIVLQVTNNGSAGAITFAAGYQKVGGDDLTTTDGDDFLVHIAKVGSFASATVQALQ